MSFCCIIKHIYYFYVELCNILNVQAVQMSSEKFNFGAKDTKKEEGPVTIPSELSDKNVKTLLTIFEAELESQAREFHRQANQVARSDRVIYECFDIMQFLERQIKRLDAFQTKLSQKAETVKESQEEFLRTLEETKIRETDGEAISQRKRLYKMAQDVGEKFLDMEATFKEIVEMTDDKNEETVPRTESEKILKIAGHHLEAMQWLSNQCQMIESKLAQLENRIPGV